MKTSIQSLGLTIAAISAAAASYASDAIGPGDSDSLWIVGGGAITFNNIYVGEGNETVLFPNIAYNGERFFVKDGTLNLSVMQLNEFSAGLIVSPDAGFLSDEDEYEDNAKLAGLNERDATLEGGFYINHTTDLGRLTFILLTDLGSEHDGQTAGLKYTFDLQYAGWFVNPVIGFHWISDKKVDHYYGVSAAEATPLNTGGFVRTAYDGDSAFVVFAGLRARYELTEHWDINITSGVSRLGDGIKDSSIVDDDYVYHASAAVSYNF